MVGLLLFFFDPRGDDDGEMRKSWHKAGTGRAGNKAKGRTTQGPGRGGGNDVTPDRVLTWGAWVGSVGG